MRAEQMPVGTLVWVPHLGLILRREQYGRKPWRVQGGRPGRFSHDEVTGSLESGEAMVVTADDVAAV